MLTDLPELLQTRRALAAEDHRTVAYFDRTTPSYWPGFYLDILKWLNGCAREGDSLLDIGCGTGATLELIREGTQIRHLWGIDPSVNSLNEARTKGHFELVQGSILDESLVASLGQRFRFAVLAFLLHHLIGRSRRESWENARAALSNAASLVEKGGYLLVLEEVVHPSLVASYAFYLKKVLSRLTLSRIDPLRTGYSMGAPVVSYFTTFQLREIVNATLGLRVVSTDVQEKRLAPMMRLAGINRIATVTVLAEKGIP